uniref:EF-hand domain-containing protein n=1 Tax=Amphora coffeiformis TaxID=265554 RepID=A0A7S3L6T8_9STRA
MNYSSSASESKKGPKRRGLFRAFRRKHKTETGSVTATTRTPKMSASAFHSDAQSAPPLTSTVTRTTAGVTPVEPPSPRRVSACAKEAETSWLMRNGRFQRLCDSVFDAIDTDNSGCVDEKELYAGLLLIHLKLGAYAGPAACRPLGRERAAAVFRDMDTDDSGELDREEFRRVIVYLFGNVLIRVMVQWSMTLLIVPLVAQYILDAIYATTDAVYHIITTMDENFWLADQIELTVEYAWATFVSVLPAAILTACRFVGHYLEMVPESVWNSIPLTLLSTVLGIAVVPYIIFRIDEFFTQMARNNAIKKERKRNSSKRD